MTEESLKITAVTPDQAATILAAAYGQRVTGEQVRQIVEAAEIIRADGTFSLIQYAAWLAREAGNG
jgi:hypothetical protein